MRSDRCSTCSPARLAGSGCTIHARSARGAVRRFEQYGIAANPPVPVEAINYGLAEAAPIIVHLAGDESQTGRLRRYCTSIVEVTGLDQGRVGTTELWGLDNTGQLVPQARAVERSSRADGSQRVGLEHQRLGAGCEHERRRALMALLVALAGGLAALGALVLASAWIPGPAKPVESSDRMRDLLAPFTAAIVIAAIALVATGWVAAGLVGAVGGFAAVRAWRSRDTSVSDEQARIAALASWCEQLRDLLSADHGIIGTIAATAKTCPDAIKPEVTRLATRLSRQRPSTAIRQFASEINDPSGDLIASVLNLAMTRSSRTSELLSELAVDDPRPSRDAAQGRSGTEWPAERSPLHRRVLRGRDRRHRGVRARLRLPRRLRRLDGPARVRPRRRPLRARRLVDGASHEIQQPARFLTVGDSEDEP